MRRKKVLDDAGVIEGIPDLKDDEQLVSEVTTKRTVRKEKTPAIDIEPEEVIEISDETERNDDEPAYSATSLAALIYSAEDEPLHNQFCTVAVRRNPDGMNDRFLTSCTSVLHLPRLINVELSADKEDIEDRVRSEYGGGHYFFQVHYNNRLASSWKSTLADLPPQLRSSKSEPETNTPPPPIQEPVNPFDQFFDTLRKQKEMKELLFGDEQKRLELEIERLKTEAAKQPLPTPEPRSEKLILLEHALQAGNPTLQDRLLSHLFPEPEENSSHWIVDLVKTGFEHKEDLAGIAQMVLGGVLPQPKSHGIEALLRQQPPKDPALAEDMNPPPRSNFQRRKLEESSGSSKPVIDTDVDSSAASEEIALSNDTN